MPLMNTPAAHRAGLRRKLAREQRKAQGRQNAAMLANSRGYAPEDENAHYWRTKAPPRSRQSAPGGEVRIEMRA